MIFFLLSPSIPRTYITSSCSVFNTSFSIFILFYVSPFPSIFPSLLASIRFHFHYLLLFSNLSFSFHVFPFLPLFILYVYFNLYLSRSHLFSFFISTFHSSFLLFNLISFLFTFLLPFIYSFTFLIFVQSLTCFSSFIILSFSFLSFNIFLCCTQ